MDWQNWSLKDWALFVSLLSAVITPLAAVALKFVETYREARRDGLVKEKQVGDATRANHEVTARLVELSRTVFTQPLEDCQDELSREKNRSARAAYVARQIIIELSKAEAAIDVAIMRHKTEATSVDCKFYTAFSLSLKAIVEHAKDELGYLTDSLDDLYLESQLDLDRKDDSESNMVESKKDRT